MHWKLFRTMPMPDVVRQTGSGGRAMCNTSCAKRRVCTAYLTPWEGAAWWSHGRLRSWQRFGMPLKIELSHDGTCSLLPGRRLCAARSRTVWTGPSAVSRWAIRNHVHLASMDHTAVRWVFNSRSIQCLLPREPRRGPKGIERGLRPGDAPGVR